MEHVFDHRGHTGVRMVVIIYVAGRTTLNFLNSIHKVSLKRDHTVEAYPSWGQTIALYARSFS